MKKRDSKNNYIELITHQLRTPLSTVQSSVDLLELYIRKGNKARQLQILNKVKKGLNELRKIIDQSTLIYKAETNKLSLTKKEFNLRELINDIIEIVITDTSDKHFINVDIENSAETIFSDELILKEILLNLVTNAIKYSPEGGQIKITAARRGNRTILSVKDEGMGIPASDINKVFEPFFRGSNTSEIEGAGLGLSIVKKLSALLQAEIEVESTISKGTEFKLVL
ncbi:sensor histidine kinase [Melioribacter sp. OK-6-Me]|uniref:sensor histidine kinase n=1 Tax=unclassified Melioribacter TaxID=2627329 RepID=UPI003ED87BE2